MGRNTLALLANKQKPFPPSIQSQQTRPTRTRPIGSGAMRVSVPLANEAPLPSILLLHWHLQSWHWQRHAAKAQNKRNRTGRTVRAVTHRPPSPSLPYIRARAKIVFRTRPAGGGRACAERRLGRCTQAGCPGSDSPFLTRTTRAADLAGHRAASGQQRPPRTQNLPTSRDEIGLADIGRWMRQKAKSAPGRGGVSIQVLRRTNIRSTLDTALGHCLRSHIAKMKSL